MDHRSLEDKILKQDLMRETVSEKEVARAHHPDDDSDPEPDPFEEELKKPAPVGPVPNPGAFGRGNDGLAPSMRYAGSSGRQGPKGVLADYRAAQADLERRREAEALKRQEYLRRAGAGATTEEPSVSFNSEASKIARSLAARGLFEANERAREKLEDEDEDDELAEFDGDDDDDAVLEAFRARRMAELRAMASKKQFGEVLEVDKFGLLTETDEEAKDVWVVAHLYEHYDAGCRAINAALPTVAREHRSVKFLRLIASEASDTFDHIALPTLIAYRGGETEHVLIRACETIGDAPSPGDIEGWLAEIGVIDSGARQAPVPRS